MPLFELAVLLSAAVVGWAAVRLYQQARQTEQDRTATQKRFEGALQEREETWRKYAQTMQDVLKTREAFKMQEALKIQEEYFGIAAYLERAVADLQNSLSNYIHFRLAEKTNRFKPRSLGVLGWIQKRSDRVEADGSQTKSQTLKDDLERVRVFYTNVTVSINYDLGTLLSEIEQAFSNFVVTADSARNQDWISKNRPDLAQEGLANAASQLERVAVLARQARLDGSAITAYVEAQPLLEFAKMPQLGTGPLQEDSPAEKSAPFRQILYALLFALFGLCIAVAVGLYHHFAVAPLRTRLSEQEATARQQSNLEHFAKLSRELAHEIRNPLTAVNARLYTLKKALAKGTPEATDAEVIQNEIKRLNRIVEQFLRLGSPAEPTLVEVSPEKVVTDVRDLLAPALEKQAIQLRVDSLVNDSVLADPEQLKQVLINLVQNAADSIGRQGTITLRARRGRTGHKNGPREVVLIEVEDDGAGIPPEVKHRLFDPFFSTKEKGTGLGLPIAARIIEKHGGALEFESETGQVTVFRIALPLDQATRAHG